MFQHILIPLDGSGTSLLALDKAAGLAKAFGSRLTVMTVVDTHPFASGVGDFSVDQGGFQSAATVRANDALAAGEARLAEQGLRCERKVVVGHVLHEGILDTVAATGADLIVMGSHGRHGVEKLLLGSTAQRVLSHALVPVLVVRGNPGD